MSETGHTPTLLPCPHCGGPAEIWRAHAENPKFPAFVGCMGRCSVLVTREYDTTEEAIAQWNRRTNPSHQAMLDALKIIDAYAAPYRDDGGSALDCIARVARDTLAAIRLAEGEPLRLSEAAQENGGSNA